MNVARHQAIVEDARLADGGMTGEQGRARPASSVVKEKKEIAAEVAALGDVPRAAHGHHAPNTTPLGSLVVCRLLRSHGLDWQISPSRLHFRAGVL